MTLGTVLEAILAALGGSGATSVKAQGTAVDGAAATGNPVQSGGVDGSGNAQAFLTDTSGRIQNLLAGTRVSTSAVAASLIIRAAGGTLTGLIGINNSASAQYIQLHDSATLPANTAVPAVVFTVPALANFSLDVPLTGIPFTTGIVVCNSSTLATKTIGAADCWFTGIYA